MHAKNTSMKACGLDFGTSNSTLGIFAPDGPRLLQIEDGRLTVPSAVFFGTQESNRFLIGRAAVDAYLRGETGRFMRSLKSILGSSLIDEQTQIYRRKIAFTHIISDFIGEIKSRAETSCKTALDSVVLDSVVHGRPVHFVDNDEAADKAAEDTLRHIANEAGFKNVSFQYEPVAAALDFEQSVSRELIALVADIGGGTSDFSVIRLGPSRAARSERVSDILANFGIRLGGTDYDRSLSMSAFTPLLGYNSRLKRGDIDVPSGPYWDLSTWSSVHQLYDAKKIAGLKSIRQSAVEPALVDRFIGLLDQERAHDILISAEEAKIALSDRESHATDLSWIEDGLAIPLSRNSFENSTLRLSERLRSASLECVSLSGLKPEQISVVFFTGGTSSIPAVRQAITANFPQADIVDGDKFGSVGIGLSIEAVRRYG